jgi:hypothetical protein
VLVAFCWQPFVTGALPQRLDPFSQFAAGQALFYEVHTSERRDVRAESSIASPQVPQNSRLAFDGVLQAEIISTSPSGALLKIYLSERRTAANTSAGPSAKSGDLRDTPDKVLQLHLGRDGAASEVTGLQQLTPAQRSAFSEWLSQFAAPLTFPKGKLRISQKWETTTPEPAPSPIAGLAWTKKGQYLRDESCGATDAEPCAAILIQATLRQKSPPKNSTPDDYRARGLKTSGSVKGQNETILYISKSTGLVVRATEDVQQSMEVTIALSDDSNRVRYQVEAQSRAQLLLLPEPPH